MRLREAAEVADAAPADADREEAFAALATFSLLKWEAGNNSLRIHRLVQEVTRERIPEDRRAAWLGAAPAVVDAYLPGNPPPDDVRAWPRWESLRPHLAAVVAAADAAGIPVPTTRLMNDLGAFLSTKCVWAEAEPLMRRQREIFLRFTAETGHEHPHLDAAMANYAGLLAQMGHSPEEFHARLGALLRAYDILPRR